MRKLVLLGLALALAGAGCRAKPAGHAAAPGGGNVAAPGASGAAQAPAAKPGSVEDRMRQYFEAFARLTGQLETDAAILQEFLEPSARESNEAIVFYKQQSLFALSNINDRKTVAFVLKGVKPGADTDQATAAFRFTAKPAPDSRLPPVSADADMAWVRKDGTWYLKLK